ncbi:MAG: hypothetical protein IRY95_08140, partial [Clostridia bacterium]|nr:hypothetical protein [Clostridia bacterium]
PETVAAGLFRALREADAAAGGPADGVILAEGYPEEGLGLAVMDRLRRAAARREAVGEKRHEGEPA